MHRRRVGVFRIKGLSQEVSGFQWREIDTEMFQNWKQEPSNSFFYKIQKTRFDSLTDRQHDSYVLFIKHGRNTEQTFNRNLSKYIHSLSRLNIPKSPRQPQMEILPNCFETNLQSFRETIIGLVCFQTLSPTATIHSLAARPSKCSNRTGGTNFCMHFHHSQ